MKLIKVETKGFKSFADRTVLNFDGGIVGIVGPNGSGKSNINDAIKWVLGESSAKSLRGSKMDDVIFAGSATTPALDKAEVTLTFDNSEGTVNIPHKKIQISRVLKRGAGSNEYYVNGELAKKKDIESIAMESGIGKSSLAIISQGTIADIAQSTPEQRRGIFEEAAGVSKYKKRKKESERNLEKVEINLEKIRAVIKEQERQIGPLKRQAEKARIYRSKKQELEKVEIALIVELVDHFQSSLDALKGDIENYYSTKDTIDERIDEIAGTVQAKDKHKLSFENEIVDLSNKIDDLNEKIQNKESQDRDQSARRKLIMEGQIEATPTEQLEAMKSELESLSTKISDAKGAEEKFEKDLVDQKSSVSTEIDLVNQLRSQYEIANSKYKKAKVTIEILNSHKENKSNLFKGTRTIVENANSISGYIGIVSDLIEVPSDYQTAISTILKNTLQHVVLENSNDAVKAINFLKSNRGGRATFIPLTSVKPRGINDQFIDIISGMQGYIGVASDLIDVKNTKLVVFKRFLLGNVIVADTIDNAKEISRRIENRFSIVTLDGDIIRPGGVMSGGQKDQNSNSLIGSEEKIKDLEERLPKIEQVLSEKRDEIQNRKNRIDESQAIINNIQIEINNSINNRSYLEQEFNALKVTYEAKSSESFVSTSNNIISLESYITERISAKAKLKAKRDSIALINQELSALKVEQNELEKSLRELNDKSQDQLREKDKAEFIIENNRNRLSSEYDLTVENARGKYHLEIEREEAEEIVSRVRSEIKELGNVNLDAIEQYEEVEERYNNLKSKEDEIFSAKEILLEAIAKMDQIITRKFDDTFQAVNSEIDPIFKTMFGGGYAKLRYTDPTNLLETGIEVDAQPPGKTVKNLKLFSGGEKALVAISLLFAILKTKPLPLCLLDEVEAALDDANVIRYAEYLKDLKAKTQFLVVTHRVGTMSRVDHLFGATMQNRGVTSFFSVSLDNAKKLLGDQDDKQE